MLLVKVDVDALYRETMKLEGVRDTLSLLSDIESVRNEPEEASALYLLSEMCREIGEVLAEFTRSEPREHKEEIA